MGRLGDVSAAAALEYSTSAARGRQLVESIHDGGPSSRRASAGNILHKYGLYFPDIYE